MTSARPPRRAGDLVRAAGAVVLVAALVIGLPVGLLKLGADPRRLIPERWPRLDELGPWLERTWHAARFAWADGTLLPGLLLVVLWVAWLFLLGLVLAETVDQLRHGIRAVRPGVGPRRWIAGLIAAILIALLPQSALALPATGSTTVATALHDPDRAETAKANSGKGFTVESGLARRRTVDAAVRPECPRITVRPGDTMTSLASIHLGDPGRYREIHRLNADRIPRAELLYPGDVLLLPPPAQTQPGPGTTAVTVKAGETASSIAQREYGHPSDWRRLWQDNHHRPQPDGRSWTDPDQLRPGWNLWITAPPPPPPVPPEPPPSQPAPPSPPSSPPPRPGQTSEQERGEPASTEAGFELSTGAFVSLGLATAVTAALAILSLRRRRRYRIGSGERADLHQPLAPVVRALRIVHDHATPPSPPATALPSGHISLGTGQDQELALNLAATGGLGLLGPGATAAARALLLHLLTTTAHRDQPLRVLLPSTDIAAVFDGLDHVPAHPAITMTTTLHSALAEMEAALLTRRRAITETRHLRPQQDQLVLLARPGQDHHRLRAILRDGATHGLAAILLGHWPSGTTAHIALDGTATEAAPADHLSGIRLFTLPAGDTADLLSLLQQAAQPHPEPSAIAPEPLASDVPIPDRQQDSDSAPTPPPSDTTAVSAESSAAGPPPTDSGEPTGATTPLRLQIFGQLRLAQVIDGEQHDLTGALTTKQRELLVFLALHPNGVRREVLNDAIWPDSSISRPYNSLHYTLSRLRHAMSKATANQIVNLIRTDDGRYQLDPALIRTDYDRFQRATSYRGQPAELRHRALAEVLDLYQGELAEDFSRTWLDAPREAARRDALDAAGHLLRVEQDPEIRLQLLERARLLDPHNESIYQGIIRIQAQLGQLDAIGRTYALLVSNLRAIDQLPSRDTDKLVEDLQRDHRNTSRQCATTAARSRYSIRPS
ncbi:LysM peptidoglycan-binding domain-containing protein [Crossiella sp. CA-258035]|uniref:LysM peptidoglycan-binding domain-containing protein n=1 Tax=Crossiella sp. CA-258035 TaxID=2981138 RepID=UPI0024BD3448|nr:LysM peptidoglycan-binding domain-containing protein [Crossiella sp. CA-258035]WHT20209.1 LysM peptidoglycan-binding domain-containing protein [Crossiella sp. CA-258035]